MTLTTHILIASAVTMPITDSAPLAAIFAIGAASHYLSDAIPHYDYPLRTAKQERAAVLTIELTPSPKNIAVDLLKIAFDVLLGTAIVLVLTQSLTLSSATPYLVAAFGAILPDALQSVYWFWQKTPITETKRCHDYFHAKRRLKKDLLGLGSQLLIILAAIVLLSY